MRRDRLAMDCSAICQVRKWLSGLSRHQCSPSSQGENAKKNHTNDTLKLSLFDVSTHGND